jgi:hypothetical protein
MSFDKTTKQVYIINSDGCPLPENWKKKFDPPQLENRNRVFDTIKEYHQLSGGYTSRGRGHG